MKWIKSVVARAAPRLARRRKYTGLLVVERVSEIPNDTGEKIFIVARNDKLLWAVFDCPCRTGHRFTVNLNINEEPRWTLEPDGNFATLTPSLWYGGRCRSHFC